MSSHGSAIGARRRPSPALAKPVLLLVIVAALALYVLLLLALAHLTGLL